MSEFRKGELGQSDRTGQAFLVAFALVPSLSPGVNAILRRVSFSGASLAD